MQHLINILGLFSTYLIVAYSFTIIYMATKFFHLAHAAIIAIGAYIFYACSQQMNWPIITSISIALLGGIGIGMLIYRFIYHPLIQKKATPLSFLITSLGLYIILQNVISILWSDDTKSIRTPNMGESYEILDAYITDIQIYSILGSVLAFLIIEAVLKYSNLGRNLRAISENENLSNICGVNTRAVTSFIFIIASALAVIAGILQGLDTDLTPTMGFSTLLYGIVAMIIGGIGNSRGLIYGALLLAIAQHLAAYFIDSAWMDAIAYLILILFLIWKPLGFSGKQLKKISI